MNRKPRAQGAARRPRRTAAHRALPLALALSLIFTAIAGPSLRAESAGKYYKQGQNAEAAENYDLAYDNYQKAFQKNPKDLRYKTAYYRLRGTAAAAHFAKAKQFEANGDDASALVELLRAGEIDSSDEAVMQEIAAVRTRQQKAAEQQQQQQRAQPPTPQDIRQQELESIGGPVQLKPINTEPLTLHMTEDSKNVYQAIGRAAGVNVLFDTDYTGKTIKVDLTNTDLLDALRIVGIQSNTFWRPVTPNTIFVAQNSPNKRRDLEEQAVQTFYLTNATQQNDLTDATTAVRNVLGVNVKAYSIASQNAIVVRGTPDELLLAQKIIGDIDKAMPEVVVDIAIMEVSKNWERTLGIQWPSSVGVQLQPPCTSSSTSSNCTSSSTSTTTTTTSTTNGLTLYNLANLNSNDFAITMGSATANLLLSDTNTKVLQNPRLRATNLQKATMKIGSRIPIATGSYQTGTTASVVSGLVNTQFQYIDIGVNVEMTPTIHADGDVTLKLKIEDMSEGGNVNISGVTEPIIVQKNSEQTIRLREGEVSILGGILEDTDTTSWSGIPGLSSIPLVRYLFGSKDHTITKDELVFMLVPHVVRGATVSDANLRPVDTGTGQSVQLRRLPVEGVGANSAPMMQSGVATTSINSTAPPSAAAAAPAALAAMNSSAGGALNQAPMPNGPKSPATTPRPSTTAPAAPSGTISGVPGSALRLMLNGPGSVNNGTSFQVPIVISGANDIAAVPLQMQYDATRLSLVNVSSGDFLSRDGQSVNPVHRDDGPGNLTINASRPAGAPGISGAGVVYVLTFQAKAAGSSNIVITRPGAMTTTQQPIPAQANTLTVNVK